MHTPANDAKYERLSPKSGCRRISSTTATPTMSKVQTDAMNNAIISGSSALNGLSVGW